MKGEILAVLEHIRADLLEAIHAVEREDSDEALQKLEAVKERLRQAVEELRS